MADKQVLVERAKLAESAERYEDMAEWMKSIVELGEQLSDEERNSFSVAYKNKVGARRSACKILASKHDNVEIANNYKATIIKELKDICDDVLSLLDNYLLKDENAPPEARVFYYKMKGDYYRYKAEVLDEEEKSKVIPLAEAAYKDATDVAETLEPTHSVRLGLALNFSVFYYEIQGDRDKACKLAKDAFDAAIASLDHVKSQRDSTLIMQLLRDNLTLWNSNDEEEKDDS